MPALQRGQAYRLGPHKWGLRYYDAGGNRQRTREKFQSKSKALAHYRKVIEPQLLGEPAPMPDLTLAELVELFLDRHKVNVRPPTIKTLRERLGYAVKAYGDVPLSDLERMSGDLATWQTKLPARSRYAIMAALRQALGAAQRWGYITVNPAKLAGRNPQPPPRTIRAYTADELDAIAAELSGIYQPLRSSPPPPGCDPKNGPRLPGVTSTAKQGTSPFAAPSQTGRSSSLAKRRAAAAKCH